MPRWIPKRFIPRTTVYNHNNSNNMFNTTYNFNSGTASFNPVKDILEQFKLFDSNANGEKGVIDAEEAKMGHGSIFFVEEGMTEKEFINKNAMIWEATHPLMACNASGYERPTLTDSVSSIVKNMIKTGQFEEKKDVIMGKIAYLNKETLELVKSKLTPEEQEKVQKEWNNSYIGGRQWIKEASKQIEQQQEEELKELERQDFILEAQKDGIELTEEEQQLPIEDLKILVQRKKVNKDIDDKGFSL